MGNTTPDNLSYPDGSNQIGRLHQWIKDLAEDVQLAINSLTSEYAFFYGEQTTTTQNAQVVLPPLIIDPARSTTTTSIVAGTNPGTVKFNTPGLYSMTARYQAGKASTGRTFLRFFKEVTNEELYLNNMPAGEFSISMSIGAFRVEQPGEVFKFDYMKNMSGAGNDLARFSISFARIGRL